MLIRRFPACVLLLLALLAASTLASEVVSGIVSETVSVAQAADYVPGKPSRLLKVKKVYDGDTLELANGDRVRILGIDAPELPHGGQPGQYYAVEAKNALEDMLGGGKVRLRVGAEGKDHYGRVLAEVLTPDGVSAGEAQVRAGRAFCYFFPQHDPDMRARLLEAQRQAMRDQAGFWPRILELDQSGQGYVGNVSSRRFYPLDCPDLAQVRPANQKRLASLREAFDQGFSPSRNCTPWPTDTGGPSASVRHGKGMSERGVKRFLRWLLR